MFSIPLVILTIPFLIYKWNSASFELTPLGASIFLFTIATILSLSFLIHPYGDEKSYIGTFKFLSNAISYIIFIKLFSSMKKIKQLWWIMFIGFALEAIVSIQFRFSFKEAVRTYGTVGDPNVLALFFLPPFFLLLSLLFVQDKLRNNLIYLLLLALFGTTIMYSFSRGQLVALFLTGGIFFIRKKKFMLFFVFLLISGLAFYLSLPEWIRANFSLYTLIFKARPSSTLHRMYFAKSALRVFLDFPLFGVGSDTYRWVFIHYNTLDAATWSYVAHNTFLEILAGNGIIGFIPFILMFFFSLRNFEKAKTNFLKLKRFKDAAYAEGMFYGLLAFSLGMLTLSVQHKIVFWLLIALSTVLYRLSKVESQPNREIKAT